MADPTNARQRTLNAFYEAPRFTVKALPVVPDPGEPEPEPTATPVPVAATPVGTPGPTAPAVPAATPAPPVLVLALQSAAKRTLKGFLADGLLVKVTADRPLADVEARLFEVLEAGKLRPLGSAFRVEPGPEGAALRIEATRFARSRLARGRGRRSVQLRVSGVGRDGLAGTARSSFELR
jgi:hypothetical protein